MMQVPPSPFPALPEDNAAGIMARSGDCVALTKTRAVWRFGFLSGSDSAVAHGVSVEAFTWIIADHRGEILDRFVGFALDLPKRFRALFS